MLLAYMVLNRRRRRRRMLAAAEEEDRTFTQRLTSEGRRRRDRLIRSRALLSLSMAPFETLYGSGCEHSLITLPGFDNSSFRYLLTKFAPVYYSHTPYSRSGLIRRIDPTSARGRPRLLTAERCLGLVLAWGRTRGSTMTLCLLFGVTASPCSVFIRFARRILVPVLRHDANAAVRMPSTEEKLDCQAAVAEKYSLLPGVYAMADGLKLTLKQSGDIVIQNRFYNGWTHDHYISSVFCFSACGLIICCVLNAPGCVHDSLIAEWGGFYKTLQDYHEKEGAQVVVYSAFNATDYDCLFKSAQDPLSTSDPAVFLAAKQETAMRQGAEWGMRALQGSFPRLKDRFLYESNGERKVMMQFSVLLFNCRTRLVGLNQILSTFMPHLGAEATTSSRR